MPAIVPAILEQTRDGFDDKNFILERIPGVERIHVDFEDGQFVTSQTVPASKLDVLNPAFHYEAHLMAMEPTDFMDYQIAGFKTVMVHYEAFTSEEQVDNAAVAISKLGMVPAVAINPETPISVLRYFGDTIRHFLVMSVHPGRQGNPFLPESMDRVTELRRLLPHVTIEVDGGINSSNAHALITAGADLLVVGSAIVKANDPAASYAAIENSILASETKT
jgi:ribulose-phosphate 3-epimerase